MGVATTDLHRTQKRTSAMAPDARRAMIVRATLPLLLDIGEKVTTRQIADAAGIAEGTIFRAFADKDAVIGAVLEAALDVAPLERAIEAVDHTENLSDFLEAVVVIMQQRVVDIWRLYSTLGSRSHQPTRTPPVVLAALVSHFTAYRSRLAVEPADAARLLRALTLAMTHPMLVGEPMAPSEIVNLFLHGVAAPEAPC
jgi:AcrR family transcriptional regulator